jgi:hypothetical protein
MQELFQYILDHYNNGEKKVDSNSEIYKVLVKDIPKLLRNFLKRRDFLVQGSMGKGNKTNYPWISILNSDITSSTQEGLYVVYLFRSDMQGFYLTLNQGITNFERKFGKDKYKYLEKVTEYFKEEFQDISRFSISDIDLNAYSGSRGYGYERSTILSIYYKSKQFTADELYKDLSDMIEAYDFIYQHMQVSSYDDVINSVISNDNIYLPAYKAISVIEHKLEESTGYPRNNKKRLIEVKANAEKSSKFKRLVEGSNTKIDYLKKAQQDAYTGLEGEKLVMNFEQERLIGLGLFEYAKKVQWISQQNDVAGYDIKSFDIDHKGNIVEIYIEVKSSISKVDVDFFVSKNEVETSHIYKEKYRVFRIYNILAIEPKYYIASGEIENNFNLEPVTFRASYKWKVK